VSVSNLLQGGVRGGNVAVVEWFQLGYYYDSMCSFFTARFHRKIQIYASRQEASNSDGMIKAHYGVNEEAVLFCLVFRNEGNSSVGVDDHGGIGNWQVWGQSLAGWSLRMHLN